MNNIPKQILEAYVTLQVGERQNAINISDSQAYLLLLALDEVILSSNFDSVVFKDLVAVREVLTDCLPSSVNDERVRTHIADTIAYIKHLSGVKS